MTLSQKQKNLCQFFLYFQNLYQVLNIFQKKITLIADVFAELPAPKSMIR